MLGSYLRRLKAHCFPVTVLYDAARPGGIGGLSRGLDGWIKAISWLTSWVTRSSSTSLSSSTCRNAGAFLQQADQQMLGSHISMVQALRHFHCQAQRFLGLWYIVPS